MVGQIKPRIIESQSPIQSRNALKLILSQIKTQHIQVLRQSPRVVRLGNDRDSSLRSPAEEDLSRGLAVLVSQALDGLVVEEQVYALGAVGEDALELDEALGAEGGVGGDGDVVLLGEGDELGLDEVGVVFDLEGGDGVAGVVLEVVEGLAGEVGDADGASNAVVYDGLEGLPSLADRDVVGLDGAVVVVHPPSLQDVNTPS